MFARRTRTSKRNMFGVATIKRDSYNSQNGFSVKSGWWELNKAVRKRDGNKCQAIVFGQRCGKPGDDVHHIVPLSRGGANTQSNLITLCEDCHSKRHHHLARRK